MPLRITIELIPRGDESRKRKLAQVEIENDGTAGDMRGGGDVGNYRVLASGLLGEAGWDDFADFTMGPLKRGDYVDTCIDIMSVLHSSRMPRHGFVTGRVEVDHSGHNVKGMAPGSAVSDSESTNSADR
jgi:hypothetical protein